MSFATAIDVVAAFGVTYSVPYMLDTLGVKVGYVFGAISLAYTVLAVFFIPELAVGSPLILCLTQLTTLGTIFGGD